jgi:Fe-S oxidoreductase
MWRSGENSLCCGAGGGVLENNPALARTYATNRWQEAKATGSKMMITACPYCYANMQHSKPKGFKVMDMTTLVAKAYGYKQKEGIQ